tara:strand:- start:9149 stop:10309 length:1161 start_codon:yes stop_codon:yes gene_type:complete
MFKIKLLFLSIFSVQALAHGLEGERSTVSESGWLTKSLVMDKAMDFTHTYMYEPIIAKTYDLLEQYNYETSQISTFKLNLIDEINLKSKLKFSARHKKMQRVYIKGENGEKLKYSIYDGELSAKTKRSVDDSYSEAKLKFEFFKSPYDTPRPLILVFPPVMGNTALDRTVATMLAEKGAHVLLINLNNLFTENKSVNQLSKEFHQTILLSKMLTQSIMNKFQAQIDTQRVGVFGVSLGGIIASTLAGVVDEIEYLYVLGAGSNLADISYSSLRDSVTLIKDYELKNNEEFKQLSKSEVKDKWFEYTVPRYSVLDPASFAHRVDPDKVFMLMSSIDTTVPYRNQLELWNSFGQPEYMLFEMSHISSIIRWLMAERGHMVDFFLSENK